MPAVDRRNGRLQNFAIVGTRSHSSRTTVMRKTILLMAHDVTLAHLGRPLRIATYLLAAGHDVILAASPDAKRFLGNFSGRFHALRPIDKARFINNLAQGRPVFDFSTLLAFAEEDEEILQAYRPDLVIGDFRLSLSASARRQRVPYATITNAYWSPAQSPRFTVPNLPMVDYLGVRISQALFDLARPVAFAYHALPMNALRRHYGLPSLGLDLRSAYTDADLVLFCDVAELYGASPGATSNGIFIGPIQWSPDIPLPTWWDALDPERPIIYITLGSSGDGKLLPRLVDRLRTTGMQLIVASAGAPGIETGGQVFSADYIPGDAAAARARLVVCNGGSPTSMQAIASGVPVLGVPGNLDQFLNMHYLESWQAGLTLRKTQLLSPQAETAISALLTNPVFGAAAQRLAAVCTHYDTAALLGQALERLMQDGGVRP